MYGWVNIPFKLHTQWKVEIQDLQLEMDIDCNSNN
jgi:hypothetical protein